MRIFIAIESSEHVKSKIFHESETLQKKNFFKGKFVDKKNLHFTLKFLGEISEEKLGDIEKKLKEIKFNRFECEVGKAGVFDSEKHIRTIWVGLISDKLKELEKKISEKLSEFSKNSKEFSSHITLARVKSVINKENLVKHIRGMHFKNLKFEVNEFLLMKSELTEFGPIYRIIERFKLV
ncbi:2',5' RNA ligase family [archaeon BMS3Abin17]|nr:2',5' RNA ligase family [archaeon BMS3Abin17]